VAHLDLQALDHAGLGRGYFHAGLVGLERQDALVGFDTVADLDEQLDYFTLTAADVGYAYGFTHTRFSCSHAASAIQRIALLGVDTELGDGLGHDLAFDGAAIGECLQRGDSHPAAVDFEEVAQLGVRVAAAEAVGAQHLVFAGRNPLANLVGEQLHVVGGGDHRAFAAFQALLDVALARLLGRVQTVPAIDRQAVAAQLVEAGHAPDVGAHAHLGEDVHRSAHFAQDGAAAQQLHAVLEVA